MYHSPIPTTLTSEQLARFNGQLKVIGDCLEWVGSKHERGYGKIKINGKEYRSHRIAFFLANGSDPGELQVCHSCDNPPCCLPAHLFLGTHLDNMIDREAKGRGKAVPPDRISFPGDLNPAAKLTEAEATVIKYSSEPNKVLAARFNVSPQLVCNIKAGRKRPNI